ncbi:MAG: hypothetical protein HOH36_01920 [Acidimicrobiaceae bacterium]|jgi:drug/metabolite transporter (DMT)-like permease|nr:hypothetical protein [Acidimicrobiaceae bacterium]MBT5581814.1 hypothetical protein [Acidimicrobiaceae bacterium]MBT5849170.1 hypothetical protein [Acidimicrobiaceae bacterium]
MSAVALALVLSSAFVHAWWNARMHAGEDRYATLTISYLVGGVLLLPFAIIDPPFNAWPLLLASTVAHSGYIWFLAGAYDRGGLATTYPLARGTAPLLVAVGGIWFLDQAPTAFLVVGAILVALGLMLVGGVAFGIGERTAVVMALITGGFIASYTLVDAKGVSQTGALGFYSVSSLLGVALLTSITGLGPAQVRSSLGDGVKVGIASATAYGLVLLAYTRGDAANIATLRATSILFGLALVPRTLTRRLVVGAVLVVAGAVLVAV